MFPVKINLCGIARNPDNMAFPAYRVPVVPWKPYFVLLDMVECHLHMAFGAFLVALAVLFLGLVYKLFHGLANAAFNNFLSPMLHSSWFDGKLY